MHISQGGGGQISVISAAGNADFSGAVWRTAINVTSDQGPPFRITQLSFDWRGGRSDGLRVQLLGQRYD